MARLVVVGSGRAEVVKVAIERDPLVRGQVVSFVTDRSCGGIAMAHAHHIPVATYREPDNRAFSDALLAHCREVAADYLVLFFNRLLVGAILDEYDRRIINVHRSLLPAFKGLHAFDDTLRYGARFFGTTFHFIDENIDEGHIILQCAAPLDPDEDVVAVRHRQFEQMCKGLIQVCHWLEDDRIRSADSGVVVTGAHYDQADFSPALECTEAANLCIPYPPSP
jgi:phosphoribosylglycinamide formyltransferase-1